MSGFPMCIRRHRNATATLLAVPVRKAEYVLIDVLDYSVPVGQYIYNYFGSSVTALLLPSVDGDSCGVYYDVSQTLDTVCAELYVVLGHIYKESTMFYYNAPTLLDNLYLAAPATTPKPPRITLANLPHLGQERITGDHHIHYNASEVWKVLTPAQQELAAPALRLPSNSSTVFVAGVMLWLTQLDPRLHRWIVSSNLLDSSDVKEFQRKGKIISVQAKSLQNLVNIDLRPVFECDVLVNRITGTVNWHDEHLNRTKPVLANVDPQEVYDIVHSHFTRPDNTRRDPRCIDWDEFWAARWQWAAAGSVHSQYPDDLQYLEKDRALRTKFITLSKMPYRDLAYFLKRKPALHAWSSTKYEWGKQRAIYGCDLTSYIMSAYAFADCEEALGKEFPIGSKARESYLRAATSSVCEGAIPLCVDFEDFNSQHSAASMRAALLAYRDAHTGVLHADQIKALDWTIASVGNGVVHDNIGLNKTYAYKDTLMSGWRLTTFVNSLLNKVYTHKILQKTNVTQRAVHNGDDVLCGIHSFSEALVALQNARKLNIRLSVDKCTLGSLAEFLRVDHKRQGSGQYLCRNIATLVHARIESKMTFNLRDVIEANEVRLQEFVDRGGSPIVAAELRDCYYRSLPSRHLGDPMLAKIIQQTHRVCGGISDRRDADVSCTIEDEVRTSKILSSNILPGEWDYAKQLRANLQIDTTIYDIAKHIHSATTRAVDHSTHRVRLSSATDMWPPMVLKAVYKSFSDVVNTASYGRAIVTGHVIDVMSRSAALSVLAEKIASERDPMKLLAVLV